MSGLLKVPYKCQCMQDEGSFIMRARGANEPIESFMDRLRIALSKDHMKRNSVCASATVEYVKIYLGKDNPVIGASSD